MGTYTVHHTPTNHGWGTARLVLASASRYVALQWCSKIKPLPEKGSGYDPLSIKLFEKVGYVLAVEMELDEETSSCIRAVWDIF